MPNPLEALMAYGRQNVHDKYGDDPLKMEVGQGSAPLPLDALGALKGLAQRFGLWGAQTAAEVAPGALGAVGTAAGDMTHPGAQAMMESMHKSASPVFQGLKQAGAFAGDRTVGNLIPSGLGNIPQPLSQVASEFVPMGEEAAYNASKAVAPLTHVPKMTPAEMGFQRIMQNRGR